MARGRLISFEGIDGSGKTTISTRVYRAVKNLEVPVTYTYEPTHSKVGSIVHLVLNGDLKASGAFQALMFAADRVNHFETEISPSLKSGVNVLVDRYVHSSIAYQGAVLKDENWVRAINKSVPAPDLAIYIDIDPRISLRRRRRRSVFEKLHLLDEVRAIYKRMVASGELVEVDGSGTEGEVFEKAWELVSGHLGL